MRKANAALVAARKAEWAHHRVETPEKLVCLALALAVLVLALRIVSVW
jgi:hypothetical protein